MKPQEKTFCNIIATMVDNIYNLINKTETEWENLGSTKEECLNTIKNDVYMSLWVFFEDFSWGLNGFEDVQENFIIITPTFEGGDDKYIVNLDGDYFTIVYDHQNYSFSVKRIDGIGKEKAFEVLSQFSTTEDAITHCELLLENFSNRVYENILVILKKLNKNGK
jgi:hypothetical protein